MLDHGHAQDKRSNPGGCTGHGHTPSLVAGTLAPVFLPSMLHAYVQEVAVQDYRLTPTSSTARYRSSARLPP